MYASLPMYDFVEHRSTTDELWYRIVAALAGFGIEAPPRLDRDSDLYPAWLRPDLLLSQTCGLPFVRRLRGRVRLVGALDHGLPGIPAGAYCSVIVVRKTDQATTLEDLRGRVAAYNSGDSQSGAGALRHMLLPLLINRRFFGETLATHGHANSIRAIAENRADVASIDAATWELTRRYLPEADAVRVLLQTPPTPGLPLITAQNGPADQIRQAFAQALAELHPDQRTTLCMQAILPRHDSDFDVVARWDAEAQAAGYDELSSGSA